MALFPNYVEVDDLKRYLRIPGNYNGTLNTDEDMYDDIPLALAINAASRAIDVACNRQFGLADSAVAQLFEATYDTDRCRAVVRIDDIMTTSGFVVDYSSTSYGPFSRTISPDDYELVPFNAPVKGEPYTGIIFTNSTVGFHEASLRVTGQWGWTEVPDTIKNATLLQAARIFKRRDAPFGIAGSIDTGSEMRLLNKVDPDVEVMVRPYKKWWGAA